MKYLYGCVLVIILTMSLSAYIQGLPIWYVRPLIILYSCTLFLLAAIFFLNRYVMRIGEPSFASILMLQLFHFIAAFPVLRRSLFFDKGADVETWHLIALFGLRHIFLVFAFCFCATVILKVYLVIKKRA